MGGLPSPMVSKECTYVDSAGVADAELGDTEEEEGDGDWFPRDESWSAPVPRITRVRAYIRPDSRKKKTLERAIEERSEARSMMKVKTARKNRNFGVSADFGRHKRGQIRQRAY